jgi:hypothetical protein
MTLGSNKGVAYLGQLLKFLWMAFNSLGLLLAVMASIGQVRSQSVGRDGGGGWSIESVRDLVIVDAPKEASVTESGYLRATPQVVFSGDGGLVVVLWEGRIYTMEAATFSRAELLRLGGRVWSIGAGAHPRAVSTYTHAGLQDINVDSGEAVRSTELGSNRAMNMLRCAGSVVMWMRYPSNKIVVVPENDSPIVRRDLDVDVVDVAGFGADCACVLFRDSDGAGVARLDADGKIGSALVRVSSDSVGLDVRIAKDGLQVAVVGSGILEYIQCGDDKSVRRREFRKGGINDVVALSDTALLLLSSGALSVVRTDRDGIDLCCELPMKGMERAVAVAPDRRMVAMVWLEDGKLRGSTLRLVPGVISPLK